MSSTGAGLMASGLLMVALLAMLAAVETAFNQLGIHRVRRMLADSPLGRGPNPNGSPSEREDEVADLQEQTQILTTVLVCRVLLLIGLGGLVTAWCDASGWRTAWVGGAMALCALVVMAAEVTSRQLALPHSKAIVRRTMPLLSAAARLLSPLYQLLQMLSRPLVRSESRMVPLGVSLEDIHDEILQLQLHGVLEQEDTQIIQSVFEFSETIAKEVMVPRVDMVCVEIGTGLKQVLELMIQCGYTRLPVYQENVDQILGLVNAKDLLKKVDELKGGTLTKQLLRETQFVPGTKKISRTLRDLQRDKITMAIVVDEYGGTDGLLTLEDIVEEIVGEITDEYDQASEGVQMLKDGSAIVDAKMVIEDVNSFLNLDLPVDEHETLGGYVFGLFERVPQAMESLEVDGLRLVVESVQRQRITRVRIQRLESQSDSDQDHEETLARVPG